MKIKDAKFKKNKKSKIKNVQHINDINTHEQSIKVPKDHTSNKQRQKNHFPSYVWPVGSENHKGPKV